MLITPQDKAPELAKALCLGSELYLKREDLHPYGSHKGRSIPVMIEKYAAGGITDFAISSSGNAALAALRYVCEYNKKYNERPITLSVYVGDNIDKDKLAILESELCEGAKLEQVERPVQTVHKLNKSGEKKALRQSKDNTALVGYEELANELKELSPAAIFVPTSSGTTAQALAEFLPNSGIYVVQTSKVHTLAGEFDQDFEKSETSLAGAIVDIVGERKGEIKEKVKGGFVVNDSEIQGVIDLVKETAGIDISPNSALSVTGLKKALKLGRQVAGPVVCLVTGR